MNPDPRSFPWRDANDFKLLVDGDEFFPQIFAAIAGARELVLVEMYLVASGDVADRFAAELIAAAERGVQVRVLLDAFGSRSLSHQDRSRLTERGVEIALYNPIKLSRLRSNLFRTHRKMVVVDDEVAFVGGAGITDEFVGARAWHDVMVEIRGAVVMDWHALFGANWIRCSSIPVPVPVPEQAAGSASADSAPTGAMRGRVASTDRESYTEIKRGVLAHVNSATRSVWFATAYFIPSRKIRRALRRAARRGVDVRVLLPGPVTDHPAVRQASRRFYARLLRHGVRLFEFQRRFMHSKLVAVDDWVSIGSSNLDRWGLRWNLEANQEIEAEDFADEVRRMLTADIGQSVEILTDDWQRRSRLSRARESWWGRIDLWLARWRG